MKRILALLLVIAGFSVAKPLSAHHSIAAVFDLGTSVSLRGKVTRITWMNPHTYIFMDVKDAEGKTTTWAAETGSSNELARQGMTPTSVKVGSMLVIDGARAKDGSNVLHIRSIAQLPGL
jgi:hypothetical protein